MFYLFTECYMQQIKPISVWRVYHQRLVHSHCDNSYLNNWQLCCFCHLTGLYTFTHPGFITYLYPLHWFFRGYPTWHFSLYSHLYNGSVLYLFIRWFYVCQNLTNYPPNIYRIYTNLVRTLFEVFWVPKTRCALESMAH